MGLIRPLAKRTAIVGLVLWLPFVAVAAPSYIADPLGDAVVSPDSNTGVRAPALVTGRPRRVIVSSDGSTVYVASPSPSADIDFRENGHVAVFRADAETSEGSSTGAFPASPHIRPAALVEVGVDPNGMALDEASRYLYVANQTSDTLSVIDTTTMNLVAQVSTPGGPKAVGLLKKRLFVPLMRRDSVAILERSPSGEHRIEREVTVGVQPMDVLVSKRRAEVYVANGGSDSVTILSAHAGDVLAWIGVGRGPYTLALSPDETSLFVNNAADNTISVVNLLSREQVLRLEMPETVENLRATSADTVFAIGFYSGVLHEISLPEKRVVASHETSRSRDRHVQ